MPTRQKEKLKSIDLDKKKDLEERFDIAYKNAMSEIDIHMLEAEKAIKAATKVAEFYGIPFSASACPVSNYFMPNSFKEKWAKEIEELNLTVSDLDIDFYVISDYGYGGWEHSAIC